MAKRKTTTLIDDLDGSPADETVEIALDGRAVEVDLSAEHAQQLRAAIRPYLDAGRRVTRRARAAARARSSRGDDRNQAIRAWWREQGHEIGERGRIPGKVRAAYAEAHPDDA